MTSFNHFLDRIYQIGTKLFAIIGLLTACLVAFIGTCAIMFTPHYGPYLIIAGWVIGDLILIHGYRHANINLMGLSDYGRPTIYLIIFLLTILPNAIMIDALIFMPIIVIVYGLVTLRILWLIGGLIGTIFLLLFVASIIQHFVKTERN